MIDQAKKKRVSDYVKLNEEKKFPYTPTKWYTYLYSGLVLVTTCSIYV